MKLDRPHLLVTRQSAPRRSAGTLFAGASAPLDDLTERASERLCLSGCTAAARKVDLVARPDTLAGYLARTAAFAVQGELLCTLGLNYLLSEITARVTLAKFLSENSDLEIPNDLSWASETRHDDGGRTDLEGTVDGVAKVIIEAKLGAAFGTGQLRSYAAHLSAQNSEGFGLLAVLVPKNRIQALATVVKDEFAVEGEGPRWQVHSFGIVIVTMCWEDVFDRLADRVDVSRKCDLDQLRGLYLALGDP
jgi:hypothetical protein